MLPAQGEVVRDTIRCFSGVDLIICVMEQVKLSKGGGENSLFCMKIIKNIKINENPSFFDARVDGKIDLGGGGLFLYLGSKIS